MRVIDGGCHADDQQQQHRRHHHHQQQQQQQFRLQAATVDDRGGGSGRQRRSENFAEQTDMAVTGTTATEVVVVTVADAFKENCNGPPPQSSSYVSMSAATCATAAPEYVASSQVQDVSSIPVGQLINVSGAGTFNVITADSLQLLESNDFKPLLCVDNSFSNCDTSTQVDGDTWQTVIQSEDGTFKPSHNVLKPDNPTTNNVLKEETDQGVSSPNTAPFYSYSEAAKLPVLPVQCETGPVRMFNPYKRIRSKKHLSSHSKKKKIEDGITLSNDEDSCDSSIGISLDNVDINMKNDESILLRTEIVQSNDSIEDMFKKLESMSSRMIKMVHHFRNSMRVAKYKWSVEKQELLAKLKRANESSIQNSNDFDVETISSVAAGLQPSNDNKPDVKKCANCNRDAFAECSLCRRTPYCSTFCQSKDWNNHQVECINGSIMVTVQTQG